MGSMEDWLAWNFEWQQCAWHLSGQAKGMSEVPVDKTWILEFINYSWKTPTGFWAAIECSQWSWAEGHKWPKCVFVPSLELRLTCFVVWFWLVFGLFPLQVRGIENGSVLKDHADGGTCFLQLWEKGTMQKVQESHRSPWPLAFLVYQKTFGSFQDWSK